MRARRRLLILAAASAVFLAPSIATATPPTTPGQMRPEIGFEGTYPPDGMTIGTSWSYAPAWWGRITTRARSGSYGLWCAGTQGGVATLSPSPLTYPQKTDSFSSLDLTQTADFYSSRLELWYTLPSRGAADADSFYVAWYPSDAPVQRQVNYEWPLTAVNTWRNVAFDLTSPANWVNLSRRASKVEFNFFDHHELSGAKVGEGITIDDIRVTGYKYGPARAIVTTQPGAAVRLDWGQPARSTASSADDTRTLAWRVWRAPGSSPADWTELTTARASVRSWVDTAAVIGQSYVYLVQAWDPGAGIGYGEPATRTATVVPVFSLAMSPSATEVLAGDTVGYTYTVRNLVTGPLHGVAIADDRLGSVLTSVTLAPGESRIATKAAVLAATTSSAATATAFDSYGTAISATARATVRVVRPSLAVTKSPDSTMAAPGQLVTYSYQVRNTGDVTLSGVSVTDDKLGTVVSGVTLAAGATGTYWKSGAVTQTVSNLATVTGTYAPLDRSVSATAAAHVQVVTPAISVTKSADATSVVAGGIVGYTFVARNTGQATLLGVTMLDSHIGPVGTSFSLAPGQSETRTASAALTGDTTNTVTAQGTYGTQGTPFHGSVSATAAASVKVLSPQVRAYATVDKPVAVTGAPLVFTYTISNPYSVTVTDAALSVDGTRVIGPVSLAAGASLQATMGAVASADVTKTAYASARYAPFTLTDTATVAVDVIAPSIAVTRSADTSVQASGSSVTHTFTITNTGDTALTYVSAVDSRLGTVLTPTTLQPGAAAVRVVSRTVTSTALFGVTANAVDNRIGTPVSASATLGVTVTSPSLALSHSADTTVTRAGVVTHRLRVTNTGDAALSAVLAYALGRTFGPVGVGVGASHTFETTQAVTADVSVPSSATAEYGTAGTPYHGALEGASSVVIDVIVPAVTVTRSVDKPMVNSGVTIVSTFIVTNTGDTTLVGGKLTGGELGVLRTGVSLAPAASIEVSRASQAVAGSGAAASFVASCQPAPSVLVTAASAPASVTVVPSRLAGADRVRSAVEMSKAAFPGRLSGERAVVIASAYSWADALPAAALCGAIQGPLLLTQKGYVPDPVAGEIVRLGASKVYIIGGSGVVSEDVRTALEARGLVVHRLAGANRYSTAREVAAQVLARTGQGGTVFVATGANFADALAASSLAAAMRAPMVLTAKDALPADSDTALRQLRPGTVVVCGGVNAVSDAVKADLGASAYGSPVVLRRAGAGRYDTAKSLVEYGIVRGLAPNGIRGMYLSTGTNYPDALAGGGLAAMRGGQWSPLMLTAPLALSSQAGAILASQPSAGFVTVLGGPSAVSVDVETRALQLVR